MNFEGQNRKLSMHIKGNVLEFFDGDLGKPQNGVTLRAVLTEICDWCFQNTK